MAVTTGNSGVVKVIASGGTLAAVGEVRTFSIEETADTIETTSMGDTARTFVPSFTTGTVSIEALFDVDTEGSNQAVFDVGTEVDFDVLPTGDAADEGYSGSGIVVSKSVSVPYDGMVEASFSIQTTGTITEG